MGVSEPEPPALRRSRDRHRVRPPVHGRRRHRRGRRQDGNVKVEGSDGSFEYGEKVPEDFPEDIPIVGEVTYGGSTDTDGTRSWSVITEYDGSAEDALDEVSSGLEDAGFEDTSDDASTLPGQKTFQNDEHQVVVLTGDGSGTTSVTYSVTTVE